MECYLHYRKLAISGRALGLVLIFLTALIWVAASFISQLLVSTEEGRPSYNVSPFLLTYLSTSVFTIFLPLVQLKSLLQETWLLRRSFKYKPLQAHVDNTDITTTTGSDAAANNSLPPPHSHHQREAAAPGSLEADLDFAEAAAAAEEVSAAARASAAAHKESLVAAAQCFLLWFTAQYLFNASLALTSVTSNTILSSTSSLFTFALSMVVLKEPYSLAKLLSIGACIGGTLLVTLSDSSADSSVSVAGATTMGGNSIHSLAGNTTTAAAAAALNITTAAATSGPRHSVVGDMLCLVSACFYASYTIVLRKSLPDDDEANVALFFGYIGLLCSLVFAPVVAVMAGLGAMHLSKIPPKAYLIILIEGILNYCLSDYLWAHAVLLLGPTIATLGLSVQIPVAAVVEVLIGVPKWLSNSKSIAMMLSGTALIMLGFFAGNLVGGGHVYGSHHRGDAEEQPPRRSSEVGSSADDVYPNGSFNGPSVVIPVSTHASVRPLSPLHDSGGKSILQSSNKKQQQHWTLEQNGAQLLDYVGSNSAHQHEHVAQRVSVEMSSIPSSSHSSGEHSNGSSPYAVSKGSQPNDTSHFPHQNGCSSGSSLPCDVPAVVSAGSADGRGLGSNDSIGETQLDQQLGGSPVLQRPYTPSRLQRSS